MVETTSGKKIFDFDNFLVDFKSINLTNVKITVSIFWQHIHISYPQLKGESEIVKITT